MEGRASPASASAAAAAVHLSTLIFWSRLRRGGTKVGLSLLVFATFFQTGFAKPANQTVPSQNCHRSNTQLRMGSSETAAISNGSSASATSKSKDGGRNVVEGEVGSMHLAWLAAAMVVLVASAVGGIRYALQDAPALDSITECKGTSFSTLVSGIVPHWLGGSARSSYETFESTLGCAKAYQAANPVDFTVAYMGSYVFLQSFALPGSTLLSMLAGAVFPFWVAQLVICASSTWYVNEALPWID